MIKKIISGGQTGADQGGLEAGIIFGIETGGWIPKGCITQEGKKPDLLKDYNLTEHNSDKYSPRTYSNVRDSDGTVRFADNFNSPGELCTLKAIKYYEKPHFDVPLKSGFSTIKYFHAWLLTNNIQVLNVAGHSEKRAPGAFVFVVKYLVKSLKLE